MNLVKIYNIIKIAQDLIGVVLPVLETIVKRDLNGDGSIGNNNSRDIR
ncbi:hypothetical protein CAPN010_03580 [Capnocytophaga cynodegmi]|uniref:Uncharacterized protein n=1 Tax=Capnocytophaga cynodegmi TaxID=28189 RepID=A0A0B7HEC5_9FLAO|nr:hypothetical protein [Capnocytophaga cynodegmi]GJQ06200.1 hypothetical protein CAPN010_03580 [Capnocytophaga cynodegmi]CEN37610.1 hypothetical protein CCYN2B_40152 [Capnocytophaga cynodegmi]